MAQARHIVQHLLAALASINSTISPEFTAKDAYAKIERCCYSVWCWSLRTTTRISLWQWRWRQRKEGLASWVGCADPREASAVLSEELLGHSPGKLARHGRAPRQGRTPGNATISRVVALEGATAGTDGHDPDWHARSF